MKWTPDRAEKLAMLWAKGLSASEIAKQLGGGISKSAVISKKDRMGLPSRDEGSPKISKAQAAKSLGTAPVFFVDRSRETGAPRGPHNVAFMDRDESSCLLFVGGESRETGLICGRTREEGKPYCCACARIAYLPTEMKRRVA